MGVNQIEMEKETLIRELQESLARIKVLQGLLPICATCKNIRDEDGNWHHIETYIHQHSDAEFTHGVCPKCLEQFGDNFTAEKKA